MGSYPSHGDKQMQVKTRQIDKALLESHLVEQKIVKMLLLGAAECGKSTVLKQMRILHAHGFSEEEKERVRSAVYNDTVIAMADLLRVMQHLNIPFQNPNLEPAAHIVLEAVKCDGELKLWSAELASAIKHLWADKNVREKVFPHGKQFQLRDNSAYFLDAIDRTSRQEYVPTEQDMLLTRVQTTGIIEVKFTMHGMPFRVFDMGGQRSERKKWIHCFEGVNSVIFITAISEFDQQLREDKSTNRMHESMELFQSICNCKWFIKTAMILFLNKKDLFAEKIKHSSIRACFSNYTGSDSYDEQIDYIEYRFERLRVDPRKAIYTHRTCATDTNQVQNILDSVVEQIMKSFMQAKGLS